MLSWPTCVSQPYGGLSWWVSSILFHLYSYLRAICVAACTRLDLCQFLPNEIPCHRLMSIPHGYGYIILTESRTDLVTANFIPYSQCLLPWRGERSNNRFFSALRTYALSIPPWIPEGKTLCPEWWIHASTHARVPPESGMGTWFMSCHRTPIIHNHCIACSRLAVFYVLQV